MLNKGGDHIYIIEKAYDKKDNHVNCALYKNEYDCCREVLEFAVELKEQGLKISTIRQKITAIKYWYEYLEEKNKKFDDYFTSEIQKNFIEFMDNQVNRNKRNNIHLVENKNRLTGFEASTLNRRLSNIRKYYKYLSKNYDNISKENIPFQITKDSNNLIKRKEKKKKIDYFTQSEIEKIINACRNIRDKAIFVTLLTTGLRLGELCSLTIDSLDYKSNKLHLRYNDEAGVLKGGGRDVFLTKKTKQILRKYILFNRNKITNYKSLFVKINNKKGQPVTRNTVQQLFKRLKKRTGINDCHAHKTRHTFATTLYELMKKKDKSPLIKLSNILGHKNIESTKIYTHITNNEFDRLSEINNNYWEDLLSQII